MTAEKTHDCIVFCDFDGTITTEETFVGMLRKFATKRYAAVERQLVEGKITLAGAVRRLVESIPSVRYPEVLAYIEDKLIREGFGELLEFLQDRDVPFVVVSGGLRDTVSKKLAPFRDRIQAIYAAEILADGPFLRIFSAFESHSELVAKTRVMARYRCRRAIVIGDGITDLNIAMAADTVFARDRLCRYLDERGKDYIRWDDFFDVRAYLRKNRPTSG